MFLIQRRKTSDTPVFMEAVGPLSPVEQAREDYITASEKVRAKHAEIKQKEDLFKELLGAAHQDAMLFDYLQQDLAKKKSALQNLGGL